MACFVGEFGFLELVSYGFLWVLLPDDFGWLC